jgi:hypothetical protein
MAANDAQMIPTRPTFRTLYAAVFSLAAWLLSAATVGFAQFPFESLSSTFGICDDCEGDASDVQCYFPQKSFCATCGVQEFWIVDARACSDTCDVECGFRSLKYYRCEGQNRCPVSCETFLRSMTSELSTTIYVHGYSPVKAFEMLDGNELAASARSSFPFRLVVWLWPAEHHLFQGPLSNVHQKMERGERQGYYLATLARVIRKQSSLTLVGHSFGAFPLAVALQSMALEELPSKTVYGMDMNSNVPIQVALVAPAIPTNSLLPGSRYGLALSQVDRLLITYNPRDRTLNLQSLVMGDECILGLTGLPRSVEICEGLESFAQVNIEPNVGGIHWLYRILQGPATRSLIGRYTVAYPHSNAYREVDLNGEFAAP